MNQSFAPPSKSYEIEVKNQSIKFKCSDGDDHVDRMTDMMRQVIEPLTAEPGQVLSPLTMKVALFLADDAVKQEKARLEREEEVRLRLHGLLDELDQALEPKD